MSTTVKKYVSAIISLDARDILPHIIDVENNYGMTDVMNAFGRFKPAKMYKVESFVNNPLWRQGVVNGAPTGSGTATVTCTLSTATSANRRINDAVMLPDGKVADVYDVSYSGSDATLVLHSVDGTNLTLADTNVLKFFSNSVGEKSIARESEFIGVTHMYQLIQIFRESHSISDVQVLSKVEAPASGLWSVKEYAEKWLKVKAEADAMHIAGRISASQFTTDTNALLDGEGGGIKQFERGIYQYITSYGVTDSAASAGTLTLTGDISDFIDLLVAKKCPNKYDAWSATAPMGKWDDNLKNLGSSDVTSGRMNMDGKEINFMVEKVTYKGITFQKYVLPILNQPDLFGGTLYSKGIFFTPQGMVRTVNRDGESSYQPRLQIRYKSQPKTVANKGNDVWAESHTGMYSMVRPDGEEAVAKVSWLSAQAIEALGAQHFGFMGGVIS